MPGKRINTSKIVKDSIKNTEFFNNQLTNDAKDENIVQRNTQSVVLEKIISIFKTIKKTINNAINPINYLNESNSEMPSLNNEVKSHSSAATDIIQKQRSVREYLEYNQEIDQNQDQTHKQKEIDTLTQINQQIVEQKSQELQLRQKLIDISTKLEKNKAQNTIKNCEKEIIKHNHHINIASPTKHNIKQAEPKRSFVTQLEEKQNNNTHHLKF